MTRLTSKQSGFQLTKWYFDCVSDLGDALIVYCAHLGWRGLGLYYSSTLLSMQDKVTSRSSLRRFAAPIEANQSTELKLRPIGVCGTWRPLQPQVRQTILEGPQGSIEWRCMLPKAQVNATVLDHPLAGLGYAECLTLTIPPWDLPLSRLQWGRFLSCDHCLIWIDWQGMHKHRYVFHNGTECVATEISEHEIALEDGGLLQLDCGKSLRDGQLGETILPATPALRRFFPGSMFGIRERKWCSRGRLQLGGEEVFGWAIHEVVDWNI
jgi:hypothetical protein